jgi:hypothetical protein
LAAVMFSKIVRIRYFGPRKPAICWVFVGLSK